MSASLGPPLQALARRHGVLPGFSGADGREHRATDEVLTAVLRALGVDVARSEETPAVPVLDPVCVVAAGAPGHVEVRLPAGVDPGALRLVVETEEGSVQVAPIDGPGSRSVAEQVGGRGLVRHRVALPADGLPAGYHHAAVEGLAPAPSRDPATAAGPTTLLLASPRCPRPDRGWGAFLPLHALRTSEDRGVGTYRDLGRLAAWIADRGGSLTATLPLFPTLPEDPSPYLPVTRLAWSDLYVDLTGLPELHRSAEARALLCSPEAADLAEVGRRGRPVDYQRLSRLRARVWDALWSTLRAEVGSAGAELQRFADDHPIAVAYARYRGAVDDAVGGRRVDQAAGAPGVHLYAQWAAHRQLAEAAGTGAPLYLDLPIGVHPRGFDPAWAPEVFVPGVHGGAPPDAFFPDGQDWGFHPLHPERLRLHDFAYLRAVLRHVMAVAGTLRIDHVMGLHRLYWVPEGFDARHGAYVAYPSEELRALVCIEAERAGVVVVGEDLGTVPAEVRRAMAADGMERLWVYQFEADAADPLPEPTAGSVASTGTHDLPRFATFADGSAIEERDGLDAAAVAEERAARAAWRRALAAAVGEPPEAPVGRLQAEVLTALAASPADLVLVDLEDLLGERQPQNRPGTGPEAGNWRGRAGRTLEQMAADESLTTVLDALDAARLLGSGAA